MSKNSEILPTDSPTIVKLKKLLKKFEEMTVEEYEELYTECLKDIEERNKRNGGRIG